MGNRHRFATLRHPPGMLVHSQFEPVNDFLVGILRRPKNSFVFRHSRRTGFALHQRRSETLQLVKVLMGGSAAPCGA